MKIKLDCGIGWADDHGIKPKRVGIKVWLNDYRIKFRKRREYEMPSKYSEGEGWHWWKPERGGLYETAYLPLGKWCVDGYRNWLSYAEAVGVEDLNLDWILDEFDSSFNDLACGSLRYHMDWAVTYCSDEQRAEYQDLIDRLSERSPGFTDEELAVLHPPGWTFEDDFEPLPEGGSVMKPTRDEVKPIYEAHSIREREWRERRDKARHDFVDIMPGLWS